MNSAVYPLQIRDFWRVNSYGYPNPFNPNPQSQEAWATFESFLENDGCQYSELKKFWNSNRASRKLDSHWVESWKATFEEFGLLYVISRSNLITVTPAGKQFFQAAMGRNESEFVWIGLNLLFRYPLHGPPRPRAKSAAHSHSNVLPYRFLFSAMRDLGDYFWWTELERIICRVFSTAEAGRAVQAIREMRLAPTELAKYPLPVDNRKGAFYNSLNQVANHAGLNHLLLSQDNNSDHYGSQESRRRHFITREYQSLVSAALGDFQEATNCGDSALYVDRLPAAPSFSDEQQYFDYLGAAVPDLIAARATTSPHTIMLAGDTVFLLKESFHFDEISTTSLDRVIEGSALVLCKIARNQRVILSSDHSWTYLVVGKNLCGPNRVQISLRRARPITNIEPIIAIFGDNDA